MTLNDVRTKVRTEKKDVIPSPSKVFQMKAVVLNTAGPAESLVVVDNFQKPVPEPGDVLVRVCAWYA